MGDYYPRKIPDVVWDFIKLRKNLRFNPKKNPNSNFPSRISVNSPKMKTIHKLETLRLVPNLSWVQFEKSLCFIIISISNQNISSNRILTATWARKFLPWGLYIFYVVFHYRNNGIYCKYCWNSIHAIQNLHHSVLRWRRKNTEKKLKKFVPVSRKYKSE